MTKQTTYKWDVYGTPNEYGYMPKIGGVETYVNDRAVAMVEARLHYENVFTVYPHEEGN